MDQESNRYMTKEALNTRNKIFQQYLAFEEGGNKETQATTQPSSNMPTSVIQNVQAAPHFDSAIFPHTKGIKFLMHKVLDNIIKVILYLLKYEKFENL